MPKWRDSHVYIHLKDKKEIWSVIYHWKTLHRDRFWTLWMLWILLLDMVRLNNISIILYSFTDLERVTSWKIREQSQCQTKCSQNGSTIKPAMKIPCIQNLVGHSCPSEKGSLWWRNWSCVTMHYKGHKHNKWLQIAMLHGKKICNRKLKKKNTSSVSPPHHKQTQNEASFAPLSWFYILHSADTAAALLVHRRSGECTAVCRHRMEGLCLCLTSTCSPEWERWQKLVCHCHSKENNTQQWPVMTWEEIKLKM